MIGPTVQIFAPTVWQTFTYGPEWFADAAAEARTSGYSARRREILFAVCAAESCLFEWVRDAVLHRDFVALADVFPVGAKRGATEKFREIPKQLAQEGRVPAALDCGGAEFAAFARLVEYRDGLVHASACRPDRTDLPAPQKPVPTKTQLDDLPPGWAFGVVRSLLRKLYGDTGTQAPPWLSEAG